LAISSIKKPRIRINQAITAPVVRLVDPDGKLPPNEIGVMKRYEALQKAESMAMDLVEVSPNAEPPVVRIMDYGKFTFDEKKAKKKQRIQKIKELKFRPVTDEGDYMVKLRNLKSFLEEGDKVKVTLRFRGREITHQDLGIRLLERIRLEVEDLGQVDQMPRLEGKQMVMMIVPKKTK
jgi:translation initiation factor IF-3